MATEREESEAEMAAKALYGFGVRLGQPYGGDHVPQHVAQLQAVYTVGSEIVRALGRIEQRLGDPQRIAELERAIAEARERAEGPL